MPRAILCRLGLPPVVEDVPIGLAPLQTIVGGPIAALVVAPGIDVICRDAPYLLPPNRALPIGRWAGGLVHGDFLVARYEWGEHVDLRPADLSYWLPLLWGPLFPLTRLQPEVWS
jgi:hypothetical protein